MFGFAVDEEVCVILVMNYPARFGIKCRRVPDIISVYAKIIGEK
jgi:hypothetical protein